MSNVGMNSKTIDRAIAMYETIREHIAEHGRPPVIRELMVLCDMSSTCTARHYLTILRKWNWISYLPGSARTMRLTRPTEAVIEVPRRKAKKHVA